MKARKNYCLRCNSKTSLKKIERSQRRLWGEVLNQPPGRRLKDLQISPLWDVSETLYETSQRSIWDVSMPARKISCTICYKCLTNDSRNKISNSSWKFRTNADNEKEQLCYFNKKLKDESYNVFLNKSLSYLIKFYLKFKAC